jgi:hypothetical protein
MVAAGIVQRSTHPLGLALPNLALLNFALLNFALLGLALLNFALLNLVGAGRSGVAGFVGIASAFGAAGSRAAGVALAFLGLEFFLELLEPVGLGLVTAADFKVAEEVGIVVGRYRVAIGDRRGVRGAGAAKEKP